MYQNLTHVTRKARKGHKCDWCGEIIQKGEQYEYQTYLWDGDFYDWKSHEACSRVVSAIWDYCDPDEGLDSDEFYEYGTEVCRQFVCPDCQRWNKEYEDCEDYNTMCIDRMDEFFKTHELYRAERKAWHEIWKVREKVSM